MREIEHEFVFCIVIYLFIRRYKRLKKFYMPKLIYMRNIITIRTLRIHRF